jgi:Reverse transcriptase (RNA-dependent DNA polymerase)
MVNMANNDYSLLDDLNLNPNYSLPPPPPIQPDDPPPLQTINSRFYDQESFSAKLSNAKSHTIASLNVQSLNAKHAALSSLLNDINHPHHIKVLALQETWNIKYPETLSIPNYHLTYINRPVGRGGGVGFYIRDDTNFKIVEELSVFIPRIFESITIELTLKNKKVSVTSVYRPPTPPPGTSINEHINGFTEHLDHLMSNLSNHYHHSYICLDSNINQLATHPNHPSFEYFQSITDNGYVQCIHKATRIVNNSFSLIDHIVTNSREEVVDSGTVILDVSDHFMTFIQLPPQPEKCKTSKKTLRTFSQENINVFKGLLQTQNWHNVLQDNNVNSSYDQFWETFKTLYDISFPEKTKKFNKNLHRINGFMTNGLLVSRMTKNNLHKLAVQTPTVVNCNKFKLYRNLYNKVLRASKRQYYCEGLHNARKNPKKTWNIINEALNRNSMPPKTEKLVSNGQTITAPAEIANTFNDFFSVAGVNIANSVNQSLIAPESYLTENLSPEFNLGLTSPAEVVNIIDSFEPKNSSDIDGLNNRLLKVVAIEISFPLSHIFNLSLSTGSFPDALKRSRVVPVHKQGSKENCDNYRPITLLSSISKILERFVATKLINHLELNKLLHNNQFGFQRGKNTEQNLIQSLNIIGDALNNGDYCIGIFIDLKKAFDVCSHDILIKKLGNFGINGVALEWFKSYLANRRQQVDINGCLSNEAILNISVLQGSILGPILFLCYINDLPNSSNLKSLLFADDTQGYASGKNLPILINQVNTELKKWAGWFRANKMAVNVKKTKFIIFHSKGKKIDLQGQKILYDDNEPGLTFDPDKVTEIERVHDSHVDKNMRVYKTLGINFDETLSLNAHVDYLMGKLSKSLFMINRVKNVLPLSALRSIYFALFHSHLLYCPTILSCTSNKNIEKIAKMQKKAIRVISNAGYNAHTAPLFTSLGIMPYRTIIQQSKLHFMHSIHYQYAPPAFNGVWVTNAERNPNIQLRNAEDYFIPLAHSNQLQRFPKFSFPREWNLAGPCKYHRNPITFKLELKRELMTEPVPPPPHPPPDHPPLPPDAND